jgi:hypothetical protein
VRRTLTALAGCGLLVLTGCTVPVIGASPSGGSSTSSTTAKAKGPWTTIQRSSPPRPSPTPAPYVPSPTPAFLVLSPRPGASAYPSASPSVLCTTDRQPGGTVTTNLSVSGTTATVTWWHGGDPSITKYRVTPVLRATTPGDQKELVWTSVAPGKGCHQLSAAITGLTRGSSYEIWLDSVTADPLHPGRSADLMVGRTEAFTVS